MPYTIRRENNKFCVYNTNTGKNEGCSDTREEATVHQRVLYGVHSEGKPTKKGK